MKNKRLKLITLIFMMMVGMSGLVFNPMSVLAAEEDEIDPFTQMPNYRYENVSTTDTNVQEQLIGDNYEVYNANNETSGLQRFEKARDLNSRDFAVETQFKLDIGGNQTEYSRDVLGDAWDFEEDDRESFTTDFSNPQDIQISNGIISWETDGDSFRDGIRFVNSVNFEKDVYNNLRIRVRAREADTLQVDFLAITRSQAITTQWAVYDILPEDGDYNIISIDLEDNGVNRIYVDFIELVGSLDFATHVEGEVEDTWDFEEQVEYWTEEEDNVADFNDDTEEGYAPFGGNTLVDASGGWLEVTSSGITNSFNFKVVSLSIDTSIYRWFTSEVEVISGTIDTITFSTTGSQVATDGTNHVAGELFLYSFDFGLDGDWTGTTVDVEIVIALTTSDTDHQVNFNFTYLYDVELGDVEGFLDVNSMYVNPNGWLTFYKPSTIEALSFPNPSTLVIDSSLFDHLKVRMSVSNDIVIGFRGDHESANNILIATITISLRGFIDYVLDLSSDSDWIGHIWKKLWFRTQTAAGVVIIDHILLEGHWSESDGFAYSLLNSNNELGMDFKFTRPNGSLAVNNITVNMYDSVGISLSFTQEFDYSTDLGWLYFQVRWDLDKKQIRFDFEYENGTSILSKRSLFALYGATGVLDLVLLRSGFPSFCLNNTVGTMGRSLFIVDYIDANWAIIDWKTPDDGSTTTVQSSTFTQAADSNFDSVSQYSMVSSTDSIDVEKFYTLDIDHLDGINYDIEILSANLDSTGDIIEQFMVIYNVAVNGSLELVFTVGFFVGSVGPARSGLIVQDKDDTILMLRVDAAAENLQGAVSFYFDDFAKAHLQVNLKVGSIDETFGFIAEATTEYTREFYFVNAYHVETTTSGAGDDTASITIGGFDVKRKDILSDIVSAVLAPIVGLFMFFLTPLFVIIQLLLIGLQIAFAILGEVFSGAIEGLSTVFSAIIGVLQSAIGGFIAALETALEIALGLVQTAVEAVTTAVTGLATQIWVGLIAALASITTFVQDIITDLLGSVSEIIDAFIGFVNVIIDDLINDVIIPFFVNLIADLGLTDMFTFISDFLVDVGSAITQIVGIASAFFTYMAGSLVFWIQVDKMAVLGLWLVVFLFLYIFGPFVSMFLDPDESKFSDYSEALEKSMEHSVDLFTIFFRIIVFAITGTIQVIQTIANWIPFL